MPPHMKRGFMFGRHGHKHHKAKGFKAAIFGHGKDHHCKKMYFRGSRDSSSSSDQEEGPCREMSFERMQQHGMHNAHHGRKMHKRFMKHHYHSMGMDGDHHGMKRHSKMMMHHRRGWDGDHHGRKTHMMHHHMGSHGYGTRAFWEEDCTVVPIIAAENVNSSPVQNEETTRQSNNTGEPTEDVSRTHDQETQTTGIMEIVLEDQEALNAVIRIVNRFL